MLPGEDTSHGKNAVRNPDMNIYHMGSIRDIDYWMEILLRGVGP